MLLGVVIMGGDQGPYHHDPFPMDATIIQTGVVSVTPGARPGSEPYAKSFDAIAARPGGARVIEDYVEVRGSVSVLGCQSVRFWYSSAVDSHGNVAAPKAPLEYLGILDVTGDQARRAIAIACADMKVGGSSE